MYVWSLSICFLNFDGDTCSKGSSSNLFLGDLFFLCFSLQVSKKSRKFSWDCIFFQFSTLFSWSNNKARIFQNVYYRSNYGVLGTNLVFKLLAPITAKVQDFVRKGMERNVSTLFCLFVQTYATQDPTIMVTNEFCKRRKKK